MIIFSISKRIKNFFKVIVQKKQPSENIYIIKDDKYLADIPNKNGYYRFFYPNGNVKAECHYISDRLEGISNFYYPSGKIERKENYRKGVLDGLSFYYSETGGKKSEVYYLDGLVKSRKDF